MSDWKDIEARLVERADEVCAHLLPGGRRDGQEWQAGDLSGKAGQSLKIAVAGPKTGVWTDFAAGGKGGKTLLSLWTRIVGGDFKKAIGEAKQWLGYDDSDTRRRMSYVPRPTVSHPAVDPGQVAAEWAAAVPVIEKGPVWQELVDRRQIPPAALRAYDVREVVKKGQRVIVWPFWGTPKEPDQRIRLKETVTEDLPAWLKFELLERVDGKKKEWTTKAPEKSLFGIQVERWAREAGDARYRHLLICEGEKDALTWWGIPELRERGILPVSVPFGAKWRGQHPDQPSPNRDWLDRCWDWLSEFESVIIAMDADEPGEKAAEDIINEIGPGRCRYVTLPVKDANEAAMSGDPGWSERLLEAVDNAREFAPEKIRNAPHYRDALHKLWFDSEEEQGFKLPLEVPFRLRRGECSIWTGHTGSGKTTCLQFCMVGMMSQGERVMIASMETKGVRTIDKMIRQVWGKKIYSRSQELKFKEKGATAEQLENLRAACIEDGDEVLRWLDGRLWLYDHTGIVHWQKLIEAFRWARRRLGINHFVVDNFMRIGILKDDYAQQAEASNQFAQLATELDCHIHLVVHKSKGDKRGGHGTTRDAGGAKEISGNAHNYVEIERDEKKGHDVSLVWQEYGAQQIGEAEFKSKLAGLEKVPDGKFILRKQREGEIQDFSKYLYFLYPGQQYSDYEPGHDKHRPRNFIRDTGASLNQEPYNELL